MLHLSVRVIEKMIKELRQDNSTPPIATAKKILGKLVKMQSLGVKCCQLCVMLLSDLQIRPTLDIILLCCARKKIHFEPKMVIFPARVTKIYKNITRQNLPQFTTFRNQTFVLNFNFTTFTTIVFAVAAILIFLPCSKFS